MSDPNRALPARPSLEYLRKEAKQQLGLLRARAGSAQLADAQHLVARAYGFSSWRALKLEVDRRCGDGGPIRPAMLAEALARPRYAALLTLHSTEAEHAIFRLCAAASLGVQAVSVLSAFMA